MVVVASRILVSAQALVTVTEPESLSLSLSLTIKIFTIQQNNFFEEISKTMRGNLLLSKDEEQNKS